MMGHGSYYPMASRRRALRFAAAGTLLALFERPAPARADQLASQRFIAEAFRLRDEAVADGDQPYGAVVVLAGEIVGRGRSRVVSDRNSDHHAERIALRNAQTRLGREDLAGAVIYSSSIPCMICQPVLARARVSRMVHGRDGVDAGAPRERAF
jgi:tRNA(Arg) A34 adenosine deaminase TadA